MKQGQGRGIVLALTLAAMPHSLSAAPPPASASLSVTRLMREALVPGLQIATIRDGKVESVRAFGMADAEGGRKVTKETVFEAASLGKPVFAYGVLKLASAGRIDLDAPISRYLPDLKGAATRHWASRPGG